LRACEFARIVDRAGCRSNESVGLGSRLAQHFHRVVIGVRTVWQNNADYSNVPPNALSIRLPKTACVAASPTTVSVCPSSNAAMDGPRAIERWTGFNDTHCDTNGVSRFEIAVGAGDPVADFTSHRQWQGHNSVFSTNKLTLERIALSP
jgi:hypothetical protein